MEKQLFRHTVLPLEDMAFRRVIVNLLNDTLNSNWSLRYNLDVVDNIIKDKVSKILPITLIKWMTSLVRSIGTEILNWQQYHENNFHEIREHFGLQSLKHLQWTCTGTIDYQKTMKKLIDLKLFNVKNRYTLACLYCLEDYIPLLSAELSKDPKNLSSEKFSFTADKQLLFYWIEMGEEYVFKPHTVNQEPNFPDLLLCAFKLATIKGNKAAAKYFFQKIPNGKQELSLLCSIKAVIIQLYASSTKMLSDFPKENLSDVLCYLMSLLSPERQMQTFKIFACILLEHFQDWPVRDLFLEIADVTWTFLPEEKYARILTDLHGRIKTSGYYCPKLYQEFFLRSPKKFKEQFVNEECQSSKLISEFFRMQDSETIQVIFRNIDAADRVRLIFSKPVLTFLYDSIFYDRLHMVEVFFREAILPKEDWQRLRKMFLKFIKKTNKSLGAEELTRKLKRFCKFFDETCTRTAEEETSEDETAPKVKKLCSEKEKNILLRK